MDVIDADWIKRQLAGQPHGSKSRLADAIGLRPDQMSKVMGGQRKLTPAEVARVLDYFGFHLETDEPATGMSDVPLTPFLPRNPSAARSIEALAKALAPDWAQLVVWHTARAFAAYQIAAGDILLTGTAPHPTDGDVVVVTYSDPDSLTTLGQRAGQGVILPPGTDRPAGDPAILGTLSMVIRPPKA
jgi:hypothetical protein